MDNRIHVLHVVGKLNIGGAESRIMDMYRQIDRDRVQFDFVEHTQEHCAYEDEITQLGGCIYRVPRFRIINWCSYRRAWKELIRAHPEIKIVHGHMTSTAGIYLPIVHHYGHAYTIAHARSAGVDAGIKGVLTKWLRLGLARKCDSCFACSKLAGKAVFGDKAVREDKVTIIPNAIDASRFIYQKEVRQRIRGSYGLEEQHYVIGHVGRFAVVKNHMYLLRIFAKCIEKKPDCRLMLVGDGELRSQIQELVKSMQLEDKVIFTGNQKNVSEYYQAFDCFVLPSFYEGLPGSAIEAQVSGLPCLLSDTITREAALTDLVEYHSIHEDAQEWSQCILKWQGQPRRDRICEIREAGYDVGALAGKMQHFYEEAAGI